MRTHLLLLLLCLLVLLQSFECDGRGGGGRGGGGGGGRGGRGYRGRVFSRSRGRTALSRQQQSQQSPARAGFRMTGIGLIFLILALICILGGLYFAAWCMCGVQRSRKEGHYILESEEDPDLYNKKLYSGLDMVDEAKDTYVKNHLDLDTINEKAPPSPDTASNHEEATNPNHELEPSAPESNDEAMNKV